MRQRDKRLAAVVLCVLWSGGCQQEETIDGPVDTAETAALRRYSQSAAFRNTIGAYTWTEGLRNMRVRGYGLVVGLGESGSTTCPERVRKRLSSEIRKKYGLGDSRLGLGQLTPEALINSRDTAAVQVVGEIPAAALHGCKFDLAVQALPGTTTLSLAGGKLFTCDLRYYREAGGGTIQEGKILARGAGPVFINPFADRPDGATPVDLRAGRILGGGTNLEDRRVRLVMSTPSYAMARQIQNKINDRFAVAEKIAVAESPSYVALEIPRKYFGQELDFLALVRHLSLSQGVGQNEARARALIEELVGVEAPHENVAWALEGIGKTVRPLLRNLYEHKLPHVSYYSARTGLHFGDNLAIASLQRHGLDTQSPYQMDAIAELGKATEMYRAADALEAMLSTGDLDLQARAQVYEGLANHHPPSVATEEMASRFMVDRVAVDGPPFVYAKVRGQPRLAVIGNPDCKAPLFYRHPAGLVTLSADAGSREITVVRQAPSGRLSPPAVANLDLYDLVCLLGKKAGEDRFGQVTGLGLSYPQVIHITQALCESGTTDAQFWMEKPEDYDRMRLTEPMGRPESEL